VTALNHLPQQIQTCLLKDQPHFLRRWRGLKKRAQQNKPHDNDLEKLQGQINTSQQRLAQRIEQAPKPDYPELPVVSAKEEIMKCIAENQVVILCGETGSGKTTQLPKICLELGRGCKGLIGHTQPRRLAARSVAARIADELKSELGATVGYKIRFGNQISQQSYIKLMTDGILLAEIQSDPLLWQYDTLIIDEAHERSLNIDFLLGYFKQLLPKRPDLKLIITSATIDPERFANHFENAPILKVEGRSYPVEVRYRPLYNDDSEQQDRNQTQAILDAVDELSREPLGDILIFLAGEREIRETAEALRRHTLPHTEVLPLFARLSNSEQQKIFKSHRGRHIVLATNVAETSLTVPGIRYVIDPGQARISRYSLRSKLQRLPIEKISQASANQRKGRCGRVAAGICLRLYDEDYFLLRPEFTEPEIQRTNLAAVILQMNSLRLGKIQDFPFVDAPDRRLISDGYRLLQELGAVNDDRQLTPLGKNISRLPIDPRLGRMLLAAENEGSLKEVLIIVSALAVQDPRERPLEKQQAADQAHALHKHPQSDFLSLLNLWNHYQQLTQELSQNQLRKRCKTLFVSYMRMREWSDTHKQLSGLMAEMKHQCNEQEADYDAIHRALLSGLLSHIALKGEEREYLGTRNRKLHIFPGSGLFKKPPKWIMAAEITETGRVYARTVAKIDPLWIEKIAPDLLNRSYFEVHWQKRNAQVGAYEKTSLYGLLINPKKRLNYGPINPTEAHEVFLREALVNGNYQTKADFYHHNQACLAEVEQLEAKSRRRDILVDEEQLYDFYAQHIPKRIYNGPAFERWRKQAEKETPKLLHLQVEDLMQHDAEQITDNRFPDHLQIMGLQLPLSYHFEPGSDDDGITLKIPLAVLNQIPAGRCDWLVPGLLEEKMIALIKSLPKNLRRNFVPAPNYAQACLQALSPSDIPLQQAMAKHLQRMSGIEVPTTAWQLEQLPLHLQMRFEILDSKGNILQQGRDLKSLQQKLESSVEASISQAPDAGFEQAEVNNWDFGNLPESLELEQNGITLVGYPALVVEGKQLALRLFSSSEKAQAVMPKGLGQLYKQQLGEAVKYLRRKLPNIQKLCLAYHRIDSCSQLKEDLIDAAILHCFVRSKTTPQNRETFYQQLEAGRSQLIEQSNQLGTLLEKILTHYQNIQLRIKGNLPLNQLEAIADIKEQLDHLIYKGFLPNTPWDNLRHYPRYLQAILRRLEALERAPNKDRPHRLTLQPLWQSCKTQLEKLAKRPLEQQPELEKLRWMLEELRVSTFAQQLGTDRPISVKRVEKQLQLLQTAQ